MGGLGKKRSHYGRFMDQRGIKQDDVRRITGLNKDTVSKAFNGDSAMRMITKQALTDAAVELTGRNVTMRELFPE